MMVSEFLHVNIKLAINAFFLLQFTLIGLNSPRLKLSPEKIDNSLCHDC